MPDVLVVDDEKSIREGLEALLSGSGYAVRAACNGISALEAIGLSCPDLVILDVMMPGLDGYETCRRIRILHRELPVVFLTAKDSEADQIRGLELGADDYLSKLTSPELLLLRIRRTLERTTRPWSRCEVPPTLTRTEASIYRLLKHQKGRLFSYREIFAEICGEGYYADEGAIRSHISRLRTKLGPSERIEARRGRGYLMV